MVYVIDFDEYKSIGTHQVPSYVNGNNDCGVEYFLKETQKLIGNKNMTTNIYRIQADY